MELKLSTEEATYLIDTLKHYIKEKTLEFPKSKGKIQFDVIAKKTSHEFVVDIARKGINDGGCTYQGRAKSKNIILMRLDVNPTSKHINPSNGEVLHGTHLHIYSKEFDIREAIPFNTEDKHLYDICFDFFDRFNLIDNPLVPLQQSLFD